MKLCAACLIETTEVRAVKLLTVTGESLTFRDKHGNIRYDPTLKEIAAHALSGMDVHHAGYGILPMEATTQVRGTYSCTVHAAKLLGLGEVKQDGRPW